MNTTHISVADILSYDQLPEDIKKIAEKYWAEQIVALEGQIEDLEDKVEEARSEGYSSGREDRDNEEYDRGYDNGRDSRDEEVDELEARIETLESRISDLEEELDNV